MELLRVVAMDRLALVWDFLVTRSRPDQKRHRIHRAAEPWRQEFLPETKMHKSADLHLGSFTLNIIHHTTGHLAHKTSNWFRMGMRTITLGRY